MSAWVRRHYLLSTFAVLILALFAFLIVDSGCWEGKIPLQTAGSEFLPPETPYAAYTPTVTGDLIKTFLATTSFGARNFVQKAGVSFRNDILLAPGIETSIDSRVVKAGAAMVYLCGSEIAFGGLPDPARPVGELGFVYAGKLHASLTPALLARATVGWVVGDDLAWSGDGDLHVASSGGKPVLWLWVSSGWVVLGDSREFVTAAIQRASGKQASLATTAPFAQVLAEQNPTVGMLSYTNLTTANAFFLSTGKPGNRAFVEGMNRYLPGLTASSWGYLPDLEHGIGKDLNFYPVEPSQMAWLRARYPKIDLRTAALTNDQTGYYAPFSLPLAAFEQGHSIELPLLAGAAPAWLQALGHSSAHPLFSGEAALLIDFPDAGPGVPGLAMALNDPAAARRNLQAMAAPGLKLPPGAQKVTSLSGDAIEIAFSGGSTAQLQLRDNFLIGTLDRAAWQHFAGKPPGPSILQRPILDKLSRSSLEADGTLVAGIVYDSRMAILNWQARALPHWREFAPLMEKIGIPLTEQPPALKPEQILSGGAFYVFLKENGVLCHHYLDKSTFGLKAPISTVPIAAHYFYGERDRRDRDKFYAFATPHDSAFPFLIEDFLRSDASYTPTFAQACNGMYYDGLFALIFASLNDVKPSGPYSSSPAP